MNMSCGVQRSIMIFSHCPTRTKSPRYRRAYLYGIRFLRSLGFSVSLFQFAAPYAVQLHYSPQ